VSGYLRGNLLPCVTLAPVTVLSPLCLVSHSKPCFYQPKLHEPNRGSFENLEYLRSMHNCGMTARLALGMACVLLAGGTSAVVLRTPGWVPGASASRRDASRGGVLVARGAKPRAVAHSWLMARRCLNDTQKLRRVAPRRRGPETRVPPKNEGGIKHTHKEAYRKTKGV